ncbi:NAD(P)H-binding protein [Mucilaginibacter arboris]|uniref:NAD(P)H-binding protein n=1 Tax=Mucilaginibacter arboris TaxID=2682090 RepID=A0A7K1T0H8_9SPHI|nr:NAD(P)H-binding protein [Mucilaginibacter arboris]MVN22780.1 NAD(P)H-binding protein [Mucilaginibacter arboris]
MQYKAVIAGASGLIGGLLLKHLLDHHDYDEVVVLVRKELNFRHQKLKQLIVDFDRLEHYEQDINGHALFCCLGSTKSKTPDLSIYRKIDHDYPVQLAKIGAKNSMQQFHLVSALGANINSTTFYIKLKGETEADVKQVKLRRICISQPSLLTGNRQEKRITEQFATVIMKIINPFLIGKLQKYRSIPANTVALAMLNESLKSNPGIFTYTSDQIKKLA